MLSFSDSFSKNKLPKSNSKVGLLLDEPSRSTRISQLKRQSRIQSLKTSFVKKAFLLGILNACILSSGAINVFDLEHIGLNNIVYTSAILTVGEFIANSLIFMFINKMKRKKWLKIFHGINFFLAASVFINSYFEFSNHIQLFNMFVSFLMKIFIKMSTIVTLLFAGKANK